MTTLSITSPHFIQLRADIESFIIPYFKNAYKEHGIKTNRKIKVSYINDKRVFVETDDDINPKCSHSYSLDWILIELIDKKNISAIVYDYIEGTTKELTLTLAHNAGQCPQCYITDSIKYVYHLPTDVAVNLAMVICNIMEIS
jgi:hypothetical protein